MLRNMSNKPQSLAAPPAQPLRSDAPQPPRWGAGRGGQPGAGLPALNMCCCPPSFPEQWTRPSRWARCWPIRKGTKGTTRYCPGGAVARTKRGACTRRSRPRWVQSHTVTTPHWPLSTPPETLRVGTALLMADFVGKDECVRPFSIHRMLGVC